MALTLKQQKFVDAYIGSANGNATLAARMAGYTGSSVTLATTGCENLRKPQIQSEIERRYEEARMGEREVLRRLADQARGIGEYVSADADGSPKVNMIDLVADGKGHLVKSVKPTTSGLTVEFYDAQAALVHIGRNLKLFTDRTEIGVSLDAVLAALPTELREAVSAELAESLRS